MEDIIPEVNLAITLWIICTPNLRFEVDWTKIVRRKKERRAKVSVNNGQLRYILLYHESLAIFPLSLVTCCNLLLICNFLLINELMNNNGIILKGKDVKKSRREKGP